MGQGRFIFVNTVPPDVPIEVLGRLERPTIMDWDRAHPIMRHVEFAKVAIEDAMRLRPLAAGRPLVEAVGGPILYALEEPDRKAVVVGFDLFKTDFPLRVAFPLILSNTLRWLHPAALDQSSLQVAAGQPILLPVAHGITSANVTTPSGRTVKAPVTRGAVSFTETDEVGLYTLSTARGDLRIAVNLMDADESNLEPRPLPQAQGTAESAAMPVPLQRDLWPLFVALAAVLLATEGVLYWRRQSGGHWTLPAGAGDRWALGVRCALVVVLALTLTGPTLPRWVDRQNVVYLLDVSDSVSLAARERAYRFVNESVRGMKTGDRNSVIVFGEQAVVDQPLSARPVVDRPKAQVSGRGTNIFQALQLALATLPPGHANRIVMLTDGRQNTGNALTGAQAAKNAGADLYYVAAPLTFTQEVVAESMVLPQEVKYGEPFQAKVVAWSHKETQGRVSLFRNGEFLGSQIVRFTTGKNVFSYRQSLDQSGIHVYQAALEVDGDTIEDNNRAVGTVVVRGRPQVLVADKDRSHAQSLAAALRSQNIEVTVVEPAGIPKDVAGLQKYDGVVLSNVSSLKLTRPQMTQIRDYVRDYGGGLMMLGGEESFGLGGYYRTPIEEALPVTMEVKQKVEIPSLAVVLSIDRSGSMAMSTDEKVTKLDLAKEAAHLVVDLLDERNEVGVMSLGHGVHLGRHRPVGQGQGGHPSRDRDHQGGRRDRRLSGAQGVVRGPVRAPGPAQARHLPVRRTDDPGRLPGAAAPDVQGQDHRVHRGHRQGRRRAADGRHRQVGPRPLLLHRGFADDPAHLHARDPAGLQGLAHRAAVQAAAHRAVARGHAGDRLEGRPAAGRLRGHLAQADGRAGADEPPGGPGPGHLAVRPGAGGRLHLGREGQVGRALAALARLQQVLGPAHALDAAQRHPERHHRHGAAPGHHRRGGGGRGRRQGRVHQLHRLPGGRGGPQPGADGHRSRADRARQATVAASQPPRRASTWSAWPSARASA